MQKGSLEHRFWEHGIKHEDDLRRHVEYIHHNPVKHGLAEAPSHWEWSNFQEYVEKGLYDQTWGGVVPSWTGIRRME
ncbi:MAG: hypothetical protein WA110_01095 [Anaerolineaceae bacterium]